MKSLALAMLLTIASCTRPGPPLEVFGTVPGFQLKAHTGIDFPAAKELQGRIWVANFVFTNCQGPCPRMTSQMGQVQAATMDLPELRMISFTVDPARDTAEVLAEYSKRHHAGPRWFFLTGPMETLHHLKRDVFLLGNIDGQLNHSTRFVLVDKRQQIRAYYDTSEPDSIQRLIKDIRRLDKES